MSGLQPKVLVIEDDPQIRKFLTITLTSHDYTVIPAETGREGIRLATSVKPDAVLLDLGLPDIDGTEVIGSIRSWSKMPILVVSVRDQEEEKVKAFDLGANDFVTKPFGTAELMARLRASLRDSIVASVEDTRVEVGDLCIDLAAHKVSVRDTPIKLSPKEFALLKVLATHAGKLLTHKYLMQKVWGEAQADDNQYLRIYIAQLRQKLEIDPARDHFIVNEPGIGYRLETPARSH
ncbi:response regulator [Asticcacaulis excentricus]|uniref:Two component transcriptional regulator, winged helix family n=1 Tax=Asticcacaulis excentricus (strain ATCC 15261 / DSM 4724 / KCTC 12464 / NCIMB 9791 / VKM B-1370 / CB 48) TaxID=573065 RepID=E8RMG4_ASTEC|nr:response regulator transcription factor [Asticcacaulis excentricus]ADU12784.1 two component transcriptional regulator, winged helix family [Asticcacaulis excentricus CB 48]